MRNLLLFVTCAWILFPHEASAQQEHLLTQTYTTADGLPSNRVQSIHQDSLGYLWVGTAAGLVVAHGDRFHHPSDFLIWGGSLAMSVNAISPGRSRRDIWIAGSHSGATALLFRDAPPRRVGLTEYIVMPEAGVERSKTVEFLSVLESRRREVLYGSRFHGLWIKSSVVKREDNYEFRIVPLRRLLEGTTVTALAEGSDGRVWIGTPSGLLQYIDTTIAAIPSNMHPLNRAHITALHIDRSGVLWVGTKGQGFFRYDGSTLASYGRLTSPHFDDIISITSTPSGSVWLGTRSRGLLRFMDDALDQFVGPHQLVSDSVLCVFADREHVVWVGTPKGLVKILPYQYHHFTALDGLPGDGFNCGMKSRSGAIWFGGNGTLVQFEGLRFKLWRASGDLARERFLWMEEDSSGAVWIGTPNGIARFRNGVFNWFRDPSGTGLDILGMVEAPRGGWYLLTGRSLKHFHRGVFRSIAEGRPPHVFTSMSLGHRGSIWVTSPRALKVFDVDSVIRERTIDALRFPEEVHVLRDGSVEVFDNEAGFVQVEPELIGRSSLWSQKYLRWGFGAGLRTQDGKRFLISRDWVYRQDGLETEPMPLLRIQGHLGLTPILRRGNGNHVLLDDRGFQEFHKEHESLARNLIYNELFLPELMKDFSLRSDRFGMPVQLRVRRLILEDDHGALWVGSGGGVQVLRSIMLAETTHVVLTKVESMNETFLPGLYSQRRAISLGTNVPLLGEKGDLHGFGDPDHIILPSFNNDLKFSFHLLSHRRNEGVAYQIQLEGFDTTWSPLREEESARFANLPQGTYRFRVRALGPNGSFSPERTMQISVLIPFWKATWFWMLGLITVVYVSARAYTSRIRQLREENTRVTKQAIQQSELRMARMLQLGMLPERCPQVPGFEIAARSLPASDVGGDFYDFLDDGKQRIGIAVGDVSGHGITGAMVVGMARTSLRFASGEGAAPSRILTVANERLRQDISKHIFVAMFYGVLDARKKQLRYICAGQPTPILIRNGSAEFIPQSKGDRFPLGILSGVRYREVSLNILPGDTIVFYTDGIVEAMDPRKEEFGFDRLKELLVHSSALPAEQLIDSILDAHRGHVRGEEQHDDITLVVLQYRKEVQR
jgi:serine phosphatase RsbU (regulator of sigma subunit)